MPRCDTGTIGAPTPPPTVEDPACRSNGSSGTRRRPMPTSSSCRPSWAPPSDAARRVTDLTRLSGHEQAHLLRSGDVSSRELASAHLDVAERQNPALNAWLSIDRDRATTEADAVDVKLAAARLTGRAAVDSLHPLFGLPVALKDLVSLAGGQCTAGSKILDGYVAPYDAHITERLRAVSAVVLGKTNMD